MKELDNQTKTRQTLEAGRDYPRTYREFVEWFPDNESCIAFLVKLRWPNGFICPGCSSLSRSLGIKLEGDWFALDVATKHQLLEVRSSIKHVRLLQLGLRLLGT